MTSTRSRFKVLENGRGSACLACLLGWIYRWGCARPQPLVSYSIVSLLLMRCRTLKELPIYRIAQRAIEVLSPQRYLKTMMAIGGGQVEVPEAQVRVLMLFSLQSLPRNITSGWYMPAGFDLITGSGSKTAIEMQKVRSVAKELGLFLN